MWKSLAVQIRLCLCRSCHRRADSYHLHDVGIPSMQAAAGEVRHRVVGEVRDASVALFEPLGT